MNSHQFQRIATRLAFLIAGTGSAAWAPLVAYAKVRVGLDAGSIGLLLLCIGIGSLLAMPLSGALTLRFGCQRLMFGSSVVFALCLPFLATLSQPFALGIMLFIFGASLGLLDAAMNIQAVRVEKTAGVPLMSGFHGWFSLGGILGAGSVTLLLVSGASPLVATLVVDAVLLVLAITARPGWLATGPAEQSQAFAWPKGAVIGLGLVCFVSFLAEGAVLDWSAIVLHDLQGMADALTGLGFAAFAATMTLARLSGDFIVSRFARLHVLIVSALLAASGLFMAAFAPHWSISLLGFAVTGLGCANIVPIMFSAIGKQNDMPEQVAVPAVTTLGYAGVLTGPAFIGFVADATSLTTSFSLICLGLVGVALASRFIRV